MRAKNGTRLNRLISRREFLQILGLGSLVTAAACAPIPGVIPTPGKAFDAAGTAAPEVSPTLKAPGATGTPTPKVPDPTGTPTQKAPDATATDAPSSTPVEPTKVVDTLPSFADFKKMVENDTSVETHFPLIQTSSASALFAELAALEVPLTKRFLDGGCVSHIKAWFQKTDPITKNGSDGSIETLYTVYSGKVKEWTDPDISHFPQIGFLGKNIIDANPLNHVLFFPVWITPPGGPTDQGRILWYMQRREPQINNKGKAGEMFVYNHMFQKQSVWPWGYDRMDGTFKDQIFRVDQYWFEWFIENGYFNQQRLIQTFADLSAGKPIQSGGSPLVVLSRITADGVAYD